MNNTLQTIGTTGFLGNSQLLDITNYLRYLKPAKGSKSRYHCPVCNGNNFSFSKTDPLKWTCYSNESSQHRSEIRQKLLELSGEWQDKPSQTDSPPKKGNYPKTPQLKPKPAKLPESFDVLRTNLEPVPLGEIKPLKQISVIKDGNGNQVSYDATRLTRYRYHWDNYRCKKEFFLDGKRVYKMTFWQHWDNELGEFNKGQIIPEGDKLRPYRFNNWAGIDLEEGKALIVAEGEKDVETLISLGLAAIDRNYITKDILSDFIENDVTGIIYFGDNDKAGNSQRDILANLCAEVELPFFAIDLLKVDPSLPEKGDITDLITKREGNMSITGDMLVEIINQQLRELQIPELDESVSDTLSDNLPDNVGIVLGKNTVYSAKEFIELKPVVQSWLVPNLIPQGDTILLSADPKVGKSLLALDLAYAVATGGYFLGEKAEKGKVLIISPDDLNTLRPRLIDRGFDLLTEDNVFICGDYQINELKGLRNYLAHNRPSLAIFDSLTAITRNSEISPNSDEYGQLVYQLKDTLSEFDCSGVIIAHNNKSKDAKGIHKVAGTNKINAAVYAIWLMAEHPNNPEKVRFVSIQPRGSEPSTHLLEINHISNWTEHGIFNYLGEPDFTLEDKNQAEVILEVLGKYPTGLEMVEIENLLPSIKAVKQVVYRLISKGKIRKSRSQKNPRRFVFYPASITPVTLPSDSCSPTVTQVVTLPEPSQEAGSEVLGNKITDTGVVVTQNATPEKVATEVTDGGYIPDLLPKNPESVDISSFQKGNKLSNNRVTTKVTTKKQAEDIIFNLLGDLDDWDSATAKKWFKDNYGTEKYSELTLRQSKDAIARLSKIVNEK